MAKNQKLSITYRPVEGLKPRPDNPRKHPKSQISALVRNIKRFGFRVPILIEPDGTIVAGAGRLEAAKLMELAEVPCITCEGLTSEEIAAFVIADNQLALTSEWDYDLLKTTASSLLANNFDTDLLGFSRKELDGILGITGSGSDGTGGDGSGNDYAEQFGVIIVCSDAAHQEQVYNEITKLGYNCKVVVT